MRRHAPTPATAGDDTLRQQGAVEFRNRAVHSISALWRATDVG